MLIMQDNILAMSRWEKLTFPSSTQAQLIKWYRACFWKILNVQMTLQIYLADICCYQQKHLPTGSALSGRIAFFAARRMFDEIYEKANSDGIKMTLYVDDITLSGQNVTKTLMSQVRQTVRQHDLKTKNSKTRTFSANVPKTVTGVVVVGDEVCLPNSRHKKIWEDRRALQNAVGNEKTRLIRSLKGRLQEAKQILTPTIPKTKLTRV